MSERPCTHKRVVISDQHLPLCCPREDERVWDGHPRVYLEFEKNKTVVCPYCETEYVLA